LEAQDILNLLDQLPNGYRTVFNLYVLEGYKHREIAEELGVSINTSKSQLILARRRLQELLNKIGYERH
jgi:RNA polymerase sigma-70 factor (ECF subfamily)